MKVHGEVYAKKCCLYTCLVLKVFYLKTQSLYPEAFTFVPQNGNHLNPELFRDGQLKTVPSNWPRKNFDLMTLGIKSNFTDLMIINVFSRCKTSELIEECCIQSYSVQ